ncbi:MAG: four helix bundle protein [Chloroflexi bacterium]|nr:four helix bundle protein [Chloroflexota bacterium]
MANDNVQGLETLEAWKKSKGLALKVYKEILPLLPAEEKWNLNQQIRRAVSSIPANITEGHGRFYYQENVRFCYIARGSLTETYSHITLAHELGFIPVEKYKELTTLVEELVRIINGYISYLKRSKIGANEPGVNHFAREDPASYLVDYPEDSESLESQ